MAIGKIIFIVEICTKSPSKPIFEKIMLKYESIEESKLSGKFGIVGKIENKPVIRVLTIVIKDSKITDYHLHHQKRN